MATHINTVAAVEYKAAADTTADVSWSATYDVWTGVAVEVAAGTGP